MIHCHALAKASETALSFASNQKSCICGLSTVSPRHALANSASVCVGLPQAVFGLSCVGIGDGVRMWVESYRVIFIQGLLQFSLSHFLSKTITSCNLLSAKHN